LSNIYSGTTCYINSKKVTKMLMGKSDVTSCYEWMQDISSSTCYV